MLLILLRDLSYCLTPQLNHLRTLFLNVRINICSSSLSNFSCRVSVLIFLFSDFFLNLFFFRFNLTLFRPLFVLILNLVGCFLYLFPEFSSDFDFFLFCLRLIIFLPRFFSLSSRLVFLFLFFIFLVFPFISFNLLA